MSGKYITGVDTNGKLTLYGVVNQVLAEHPDIRIKAGSAYNYVCGHYSDNGIKELFEEEGRIKYVKEGQADQAAKDVYEMLKNRKTSKGPNKLTLSGIVRKVLKEHPEIGLAESGAGSYVSAHYSDNGLAALFEQHGRRRYVKEGQADQAAKDVYEMLKNRKKRSDEEHIKTDSGSNDMLLQVYLKEVARTSLLTREEEVGLAKKIELYRANKDKPGYSSKLEEAVNAFAMANLRLVISISKIYKNVVYGFDLLDLVSEGNIGLLHAINLFDYRRGAKFSTYAVWWIKQAIKRAISEKGHIIRLPNGVVNQVLKINKTEETVLAENGHTPLQEEFEDLIGGTPKATQNALRARELRSVSLYTEGGQVLLENAESADATYTILGKEEGIARLKKMLAVLDPREDGIISLRFGLNNGEGLTLEEIADQYGLTRERVRQIQNNALKKLRMAFVREGNNL